MGWFDDFNAARRGAGKRIAQTMGAIPTDEQMALRSRELDLREQELQSLLPLREEELQNSRFARKLNMQQLELQTNMEAGLGLPRGGLQTRQIALGLQGQQADIQARQLETKSQAYKFAQMQRSPKEKLDEIRALNGLATGTTPEDQEAYERVAKATQNDQNARRAELMASFAQDFGSVDRNASQLLGRNMSLFGGDDVLMAVNQYEKLLASNPNLSEDDAYQQVLSTGMNLAQQKFRTLTAPGIGPEQSPFGAAAFGASTSEATTLFPVKIGQQAVPERIDDLMRRISNPKSKSDAARIGLILRGEGLYSPEDLLALPPPKRNLLFQRIEGSL